MTQVSWTKNLILAVLLCALGAFAYWLQFKHKPEQSKIEENEKKPFLLKDHQIESMRFVAGPRSFLLVCQDLASKGCKPGDNTKWKLTEPLQVRADDTNANSLVSTFNNLSATDIIDLKEETSEKRAQLLKEYELPADDAAAASTRKFEVKTDSGTVTLYVGGTHPINQGIFTMLASNKNKVFVVPSYFKSSLDRDIPYWRDKKIFAFNASEIDGFELRDQKGTVISGAKKNGAWTIHGKDGEASGDPDTISALISAGSFLLAKDFASENKTDAKAKAALKGAKEVLRLNFKKGQEVFSLTILKKDQKKNQTNNNATYATASSGDPLYELQPTAEIPFSKSWKDLRLSKLITSSERFDIKKMVFEGKPIGAKALTLVSKDGKWQAEGETTAITESKVQSTLDRLSGNRIHEFLSGKDYPTGEQDGLFVSLGDEKNPAKRRLVFWKKGGKLYGRDLGAQRKEAFVVDSAVGDALPWDRTFYK